MNKMDITKTIAKVKFNARKYSPEIFMGLGVVSMVGSTVLACKATLKVKDIMDESELTKKIINDTLAQERDDYSAEDARKDMQVTNVQTAVKIGLNYTPAVVMGGVSILCMLTAHNVLRNRNAALAAALATTTQTFTRYRNNVISKYGEETDKEMRYGIRKEKVSTEYTDESGKTKTKKETVDVVGEIDQYSDYARFFDNGNANWNENPEYTMMYLKAQQQYANDKLVSQGYLFLNDVYDMLDIPRSKAGQVVGWIYDAENPAGDNYVDFGLYDVSKENARDFVNGLEKTVLLDFNVDGNIWDLMNN